MARGITYSVIERKKVRRPGVHAKTKTSGLKLSKYYKKNIKAKEEENE